MNSGRADILRREPNNCPARIEACSRLRRLGRWYVLRYETAGAAAWDEPRGGEWTLREIAEHVAEVRYYAEQVGSLAVLDPG
jgi:hypothetical protein